MEISINGDIWENYKISLLKLRCKEAWLENRIRDLRRLPDNEMLLSAISEMTIPKKQKEDAEAVAYMQAVEHGILSEAGDSQPMELKYRICNRQSREIWLDKLETQLDRVRGRIQTEEQFRREMAEKQYRLAVGKVTGEFCLDLPEDEDEEEPDETE